MRSAVRFAAAMPASCAVPSTSPFFTSFAAIARASVGPTNTAASTVADRRVCGFPPTSTIRTPPGPVWVNATPRLGSSCIPGT